MRKRTSDITEPRVTLKTLAEHLHLTAGTISAALNDSAAARAIPEHTKRRIIEAARELNYKPNYFARSLRLQRTNTIGVAMRIRNTASQAVHEYFQVCYII